jgi:hypothetical protein
VLTGKLDQRRACVDVSWSLGRDIKPGQLSQMVAQLGEWSSQCDATVSELDGRVKWASTNAAEKACERLALNLQLENVKKGVKMEAEVRGGGEGAPPQFDKGSEGSQMAEEDRLGAGRTKRYVSERVVKRARRVRGRGNSPAFVAAAQAALSGYGAQGANNWTGCERSANAHQDSQAVVRGSGCTASAVRRRKVYRSLPSSYDKN